MMTDTIHIQDYYHHLDFFHSIGRGLTGFCYHPGQVQSLMEHLKQQNIIAELITLSERARDQNKFIPDTKKNTHRIIVQDLPAERFSEIAGYVLRCYIMPHNYGGYPVSFFSRWTRETYIQNDIKSAALHENQAGLIKYLTLDHLFQILKFRNFTAGLITDHDDMLLYQPLTDKTVSASGKSSVRLFYEDHSSDPILPVILNDQNHCLNGFRGSKSIVPDEPRFKAVSAYQYFANKNNLLSGINQTKRGSGEIVPVDEEITGDPFQRQAVYHGTGPIRVLAPAGSGKTKVLINRIIHLISKGVAPSSILALAFNKKAAMEMRNRLSSKKIPVSARFNDEGVAVRTFHSLGYEIIQQTTGWRYDNGLISQHWRPMLEAVLKEHRAADKHFPWLEPSVIEDWLTVIKNEIPEWKHLSAFLSMNSAIVRSVYEAVLRKQEELKLITFDDMLYLALKILIDQTGFRHTLQNRFEFILVDEFQDINRAQLLLMQVLAAPQNNLFVVGDDDQMIYGWRGAEVEHILNFNDHYPDAPICILQTNYRSAQAVIRHSKRLIRHNRQRVDKDIQSRPSASEGLFRITLADDLLNQAEQAVQWMLQTKNSLRLTWDQLAVLYRYHVYQFPFALILDRYNIPHTPVRMERLFQTAPGRDIASYLSVILFPEQATREDYQRILKHPTKYFTNEIIYPVLDWTALMNLPAVFQKSGNQDKSRVARKFVNDIASLRNDARLIKGPAPGFIAEIEKRFHLSAQYKNSANDNYERDAASDDIIYDVIRSTAALYDDALLFYKMIRSVSGGKEEAAPDSSDKPDGVVMTTIHRTKGNEYPYVVYYNLSDRKRKSDANPEEERRVCYVGVTRAINGILVTAPVKNYSDFLPELLLNPEWKGYSDFRLSRLLKEYQKKINKWESRIEKSQMRSMVLSAKHPPGGRDLNKMKQFQKDILEWEESIRKTKPACHDLENEIRYRRLLRRGLK